jgi:hypothetical protein
MKWFTNMKMATKLIAGFLIIASITATVGLVGIFMLQQTDSSYKSLYTDYGISQGMIGTAALDFNQIRVKLYEIVYAEDSTAKQQAASDINQLKVEISLTLNDFGKTVRTSVGQKTTSELNRSLQDYYSIIDTVVNLSMQGKNSEAVIVMNAGNKIAENTNQLITDSFNRKTANGELNESSLSKQANTVELVLWFVVGGGVALALLLGFNIIRNIGRLLMRM